MERHRSALLALASACAVTGCVLTSSNAEPAESSSEQAAPTPNDQPQGNNGPGRRDFLERIPLT